MALENQLSRYGAIAKNLGELNPQAKVFFVAPSTAAFYADFANEFPADKDGVTRVYTSITAALASCVADRGDTILVLPGYTETITTAGGLAVSTAGVSIIGLGVGTVRPTITFTTSTAATATVTAANVTIKNIIFTCGIDAQVSMIPVSGAYVTFDGCEFNTNSGTVGAVLGILTSATATGLKVINSRFLGPAINAGTTTTAQIKHEVGTDYVIKDNYFTGKMTQAFLNATGVLRGLIDSNRFVVATGTVAITMHASSTPFITNNRMNVASGTAPIVAAAGFVAGNVYSAAAGVTAGTAATI